MTRNRNPFGVAITKVRQARGYSLRELARRAGISAGQLSRIEAGGVRKPSMETLGALARALGRNPRFLWIASGHIPVTEGGTFLGKRLWDQAAGSKSLAAAGDDGLLPGWNRNSGQAPPEHEVRTAAAKAFETSHADQATWWDAYLDPVRLSPWRDLDRLRQDFESLTAARRRKVLEYLRDQMELSARDADERIDEAGRDERR